MANWNEFERETPELAELGRSLLYRGGEGLALLATVRGNDLPPRIHPVNLEIVDGRLLTFIHDDSAKGRDLAEDGRYAVHAHQDPDVPHEFQARGRATLLTNPSDRSLAADVWPFSTNEAYLLFELDIEHVLVGQRPSADDWPPVYRSWKARAAEPVA
jgi:Pyridoxamine 5'-phosphate oxidase